MKIEKIYIIHFEKLEERRNYLEKELKVLNIQYEFITSNKEKDQKVLENKNEFYKYHSEIYQRRLDDSEICVSVQHFVVLSKILEEGIQNALVLEDDAVFAENFLVNLEIIEKELPENYDFCFISSCCNLKIQNISPNKMVYKSNTSRCATGYLVNCRNLKKIYSTLPFQYPIDWHLNFINSKNEFNFFWSEPCLILQGSEFKYKSNLR